MARTYSGGSLLSFIVVGAVLAGLLIGGAYTANRYWQTTGGRPVAVTPKPAEKKTNSGQPAARPNTPLTDDSQPQPSNNTPTPQPTPNTNTNTPAPIGLAPTGPSQAAPETNVLPQTGPADTLLTVVMAASLVGVLLAYRRSRLAVSSF